MSTATPKENTPQPQRQPPTPQYSDDDDYDYDSFSDDDDDGYYEEENVAPGKNQLQHQTQQQTQQPPQQQQQQHQRKRPMKTASKHSADTAMLPFEYIGPPETSMDGPVTYARAQRGEIPMRPGNPNQRLKTAEKPKEEEQDGLRLKLEINLDVEVELKAVIHGDLTLALL
ncbi:hypothetical protein PAAG_00263 [Paracoccidioides lutzii Pb01]|uniref:Uncharacterized protein n=1 Tax=Paracoccidioides lutzii (strain ATCC MYA-826 / Pb01) TaxID=502779 RepID=C1GP18_PARBA|nr:hypothetical protein PAAG_00263 [Paracoccidioides lutzii Pb01]EEH35940.2 hypothetical protein PAAG_00263 [Paracoccidioides lutzii Pb01]